MQLDDLDVQAQTLELLGRTYAQRARSLREGPECPRTHNETRHKAKRFGISNSFLGSSHSVLERLVQCASDGERVPEQLLVKAALAESRAALYEQNLSRLSLRRLARAFPSKHWKRFQRHGWSSIPLKLSRKERRMMALGHRVALAELGVDPANPATFENAKHVKGYSFNWGWLRNPGCLPSQAYIATHPRMYKLYVGLHARLLLQQGRGDDEAAAVRGVVQLRLQLYNSKLALPKSDRARGFSHLDCDWRRGGCGAPAPQCVLATSPSHVEWEGAPTGKSTVFSCRFAPLNAEERRVAEGANAREATPSVEGASDRLQSRKRKRYGKATQPPDRLVCKFETEGTGPTEMKPFDALFFDHLCAHEFVQHRIPLPPDVPIPVELTRTAEFPTLTCPFLHGAPNQTKEEVLACLLSGRPPARWAHPHTGNPVEATMREFYPTGVLPVHMETPLQRCLCGVDDWGRAPAATEWLLRALASSSPKAALKTATAEAVALHRQQLDSLSGRLEARLSQLASVPLGHSTHGLRSPLSNDAGPAVRAAATAALRDKSLFRQYGNC